MTRKEQIRQAALEDCRSSELPDKEFNFRGVNSAYGLGFCEGAMWADRNPKDGINWQQVRIQAAIAAMQGMCASKSFFSLTNECIPQIAVKYADSLVKELKGG